MADRFDEQDFFSEEFEKKQQQTEVQNRQSDTNFENASFKAWSATNVNSSDNPNKTRRVTAILLAVAFLFVFVFGILVSSFLFNSGDDLGILREVLKTIRRTYYDDLTDEQWDAIVANGGTAMLQTIDRYGYLRNPQDAYDYLYPVADASNSGEYFGFSYQYMQGLGLIVATIVADSSSFGVLREGDIVLSISQLLDRNNNQIQAEINFSELSSAEFATIFAKTFKATFTVLRNNTTQQFTIERGLTENSYNNGRDQMYCVEYYFGEQNTNMSMTNQNKAQTNSKQFRHLDELANNVGYIRIIQFASYEVDGTTVGCEDEFEIALGKFKQSGKTKLVVDLKGNPGGNVSNTAEIVGMLGTSSMLTDAEKAALVDRNGQLLVTSLEYYDGSSPSKYYAKSKYDEYFSFNGQGTPDIAVWTDGNSASASELLTGAVLDFGTAVQMGTTTYGKGIAQVVIPLQNFSAQVQKHDGTYTTFYWCLTYTTAKYNSPKGENIHGTGYTPRQQHNNLREYADLVTATNDYWN